MEGAPALQRYMAGDMIRIGLVLEHAANLARVFVAFSHEQDHLTELYFETTSQFETEDGTTGGAKRSRVLLEAPVPPESAAGVYELTRVNVYSIGGKLARLSEGGLAGLAGARFEIVEEPAEVPTVARLEFLA